jgi:hypothetical protein
MAEVIKRELAERGRRVVVSAGAVLRADSRSSGADDVLAAARAFVNHERHMCATEAALAELGATMNETDHALAAISQMAGRLPIVRAGMLAALDIARVDSNSTSKHSNSDADADAGLTSTDNRLAEIPAAAAPASSDEATAMCEPAPYAEDAAAVRPATGAPLEDTQAHGRGARAGQGAAAAPAADAAPAAATTPAVAAAPAALAATTPPGAAPTVPRGTQPAESGSECYR